MQKLKLFLENFLIYGFGGIISKIIPLVMVPIVTRLMPNTEYYGISDLSQTVVSFGQALAIMGMYDAMYRLFFDKDDEKYKEEICSTTLFFTLMTSVVVFALMILFKDAIAKYAFGSSNYNNLVYVTAIATLVGATNSIVSAPTRMQNKRIVYLVMNTVSPVLSYSISIPLLLTGHYLFALPVAGAVAGITCELTFFFMNRKWFSIKKIRLEYLKPLLSIAIPLLPNFLIYWIFNSCDKLMITNILNAAETGIYSVGSKFGHASQLIYTAFAGGWQFFAFSTMNECDQVDSNSKIFEYLGVISFSCAAFIFALSKPLFQFFFTGDYVGGYIVAPYLFLAPLLQMLFQVAANQFLVVKKTWPNLFILSLGAVLNIFLNLTLIPLIGIEGASIATLAGYIVSDVICVVVLCKMNLMIISKRFLISCIILLLYILIWRFWIMSNILVSFVVSVFVCGIYIALYRKDLKFLFSMIKKEK